ncbi:MAG: radical SAM protein [Candidatus Omnitrophica bacterium]|nr:radical SAM protein [Candidatus Omnitrophota bacterium]
MGNISDYFDSFKFFLANFYFTLMRKPLIIKLFGIKYERTLRNIEIDLSYYCQLKCFNCNRSCRQAPTEERMSVDQIKKFIKESKDSNIKWQRIRLLGGEPTMHPDIFEIMNLILDYKFSYSPNTVIHLVTNGFGEEVSKVLSKVPNGIEIFNSQKKSPRQLFSPFNLAPLDYDKYRDRDYTDGCVNYSKCGIGLSLYGYYCCGNAAGIDRVLGFNAGRKKIPIDDDAMKDHLQIFCKFCGVFTRFKLSKKELISASWKKAYEKYRANRPKLTLF